MSPLATMLVSTCAAGACIPLGGWLAFAVRRRSKSIDPEFVHFMVAFGGGILVAAISLVLLPEGIRSVQVPPYAAALFVSGGVACFAVERYLGIRRRESPQFAAMLLDYVPESVALGGMFAVGSAAAPLLAVLIGLQNLPEGFNAYLERTNARGAVARTELLHLLVLVPIGPLLGTIGWFLLAAYPVLLGSIMMFSAGAILYLIFQDIAPQSKMKKHWLPPLGAVCGFGVALFGQQLIGA